MKDSVAKPSGKNKAGAGTDAEVHPLKVQLVPHHVDATEDYSHDDNVGNVEGVVSIAGASVTDAELSCTIQDGGNAETDRTMSELAICVQVDDVGFVADIRASESTAALIAAPSEKRPRL